MKSLPDAIREDRERAAVKASLHYPDAARADATKKLAQVLQRTPGFRVANVASLGLLVEHDGRQYRIQIMRG